MSVQEMLPGQGPRAHGGAILPLIGGVGLPRKAVYPIAGCAGGRLVAPDSAPSASADELTATATPAPWLTPTIPL